MKFIKVFCCLFFLLVLGGQNTEGQSWLWGRQGRPPISWVAYNSAEGFAGAMDYSHNVYITGQFSGDTKPTLIFGIDTLTFWSKPSYNQTELFIAKYTSNGNLLFAIQSTKGYIEGNRSSNIVTDLRGNILVTGSYYDSISFGAFQLKPKDTNANVPFLVKYDSNGNVLWAKQALIPSGYSSGTGSSVTTDNHNNSYIAGTFWDTLVFPLIMIHFGISYIR